MPPRSVRLDEGELGVILGHYLRFFFGSSGHMTPLLGEKRHGVSTLAIEKLW